MPTSETPEIKHFHSVFIAGWAHKPGSVGEGLKDDIAALDEAWEKFLPTLMDFVDRVWKEEESAHVS